MNKRTGKLLSSTVIFTLLLVGFVLNTAFSKKTERDYYQIKIYTIENESQEKRMDEYLKNAFIPAMHRAGIAGVGIFKPREGEALFGKRIFVLIPYKDVGEFAGIPGILDKDAKYLKDGKDYIEAAHDNAPYQRIESILLRSFSATPAFHVPEYSTSPSERIYELRSYQGATERYYERKVEMFNVGEADLFIKLGFQPILFGEVISGPDMPNLMYLTTFSDTASHVDHWNAFRDSEEWTQMKTIEKYKNTVSGSDKYLLYPSDYSDF